MTEDTNFSRHQNLFNTLHNMGYILLESELQEVVSSVEKDKMENSVSVYIEFLKWYRDTYEETPYGISYDFIVDEFIKNKLI